ncbi:MAG: DUF2007 domain-containing protein [Lysobacterales bacterium]
MRLVYRAENLIDGHLVRHALEAAEIHCFVSGQYSTGGIGELPTFGLVNVLVADEDLEAAQQIVAELSSALQEASEMQDADDQETGPDWEPSPA